jgi:type II secretory pathway predicted ATPase ExeA
MVMKLEEELKIENPRNHSAESVEVLRQLLAGGVRVAPDPKRPDFYEVESRNDVYYIHVSPVSGKILLLAAWPKEVLAGEMASSFQTA